MTAFAAILQKRPAVEGIDRVAQAIEGTGAAHPRLVSFNACDLLLSPLHADDPPAPAVRPDGIAVTGTVLLEARRDLALTLEQDIAAPGIVLAGAAYARWGSRCTERLTGEYAFAIWDSNARTLVCARDGMGLRLLYVADSPDVVVVTNILAAALAHPSIRDERDDVALVEFLSHGGAMDGVRTAYRHVRALPAGHTLTIDVDRNTTRMYRHWHFPVPAVEPYPGDQEVHEAYRAALAEAVRDRLSDSTTVFLSGGVDSTTIAAAAREVAPSGRLHALTAQYPRFAPDDEVVFARMAATHLHIPVTVIDADRHDPWHPLSVRPAPPEPLDEPMLADWRGAVAAAAANGTVALYGEDGDALFAPPAWPALRNATPTWAIAAAVARYAATEWTLPYLGLRLRERLGMAPRRPGRDPAWLKRDAGVLLEQAGPATVLGHAAEPLPLHPTHPDVQARMTATTFSRDFSLAISPEVTRQQVELRFPLFDTRIVRLVLSLPAIPWCQHKRLPRGSYSGRLPQAVLERPKSTLRGYNEAAVAAWQRSPDAAVTVSMHAASAWVDRDAWLTTLRSGSADDVMEAWRVFALEAWSAEPAAAGRDARCIR
jgi:asparagine synthase (glutamine-hydrolysing)